jgi:hypothetical protein
VDSKGIPWDGRIHSSPGKKGDPKPVNKDGTWRQKRGTADTYVAQITAELRAAMAANTAAAVQMPAPPSSPAVPSALPLPPLAAVPPLVPPAPAGINFGQLANKVTEVVLAGKTDMVQVNAIVARHGLQQFNQLMHAPAVVALVDADLSTMLGLAPGAPA